MTTVQPLPPTLDRGGDTAPAAGPASKGPAAAPGSCREESPLGDHGASHQDEARSVRRELTKAQGHSGRALTPAGLTKPPWKLTKANRRRTPFPWPRSMSDTRPHPSQETLATGHSWPAPRASGVYQRSRFPTSLYPHGPPLLSRPPTPPTPPRELGEAGGD